MMKRRPVLAMVALFALVALSCRLFGGAEEEAPPEPTTPPAAPVEQTPVPPGEPTATPEAEQLPPAVRQVDGMTMVHIPEGEFPMRLDETAFASERPAHIVFLDE